MGAAFKGRLSVAGFGGQCGVERRNDARFSFGRVELGAPVSPFQGEGGGGQVSFVAKHHQP